MRQHDEKQDASNHVCRWHEATCKIKTLLRCQTQASYWILKPDTRIVILLNYNAGTSCVPSGSKL